MDFSRLVGKKKLGEVYTHQIFNQFFYDILQII